MDLIKLFILNDDIVLDIDYNECVDTSVLGESKENKVNNPKTGIRELALYLIPMSVLLIILIFSNKKSLFKKI